MGSVATSSRDAGDFSRGNFQKNNQLKQTVNFKGYKVHVLDGAAHGDTMEHFARAIVREVKDIVDVVYHKTETNPTYSGLKQMDALAQNLHNLNKNNVLKSGDFLAITGSAQVQLNQLAVEMGLAKKTIRPDNVTQYKNQIIDFLATKEPSRELDPNGQKFSFVPQVITEINELIKKGVNVYLPAGHPIEAALKAKMGGKGLKDELYKYIYTRGKLGAEDVSSSISELKAANYYKFNLLALSDAHVVNVRDFSGKKDYVFAAYDNCVNDGERGVYNFYPVRDKKTKKVLGYSFTDKRTIHYPYNEFLANKEFENIARYVGLKSSDNIMLTHQEMLQREYLVKCGERVSTPPLHFLKRLNEVFSEKTIEDRKLNELGFFTTNDGNLFFAYNRDGEIYFPKADCEGSGRPSVLSMWGSCFASITAAKRDIAKLVNEKLAKTPNYTDKQELLSLNKALDDVNHIPLKIQEYRLNRLIKHLDKFPDNVEWINKNIAAHIQLFDVLKKQNLNKAAEVVANQTINLKCKKLLSTIADAPNAPHGQAFASSWKRVNRELFLELDSLAELFDEISRLCESKQNVKAQTVSKWAVKVLKDRTPEPVEAIIRQRADKHINIGEIFNEYNKHNQS